MEVENVLGKRRRLGESRDIVGGFSGANARKIECNNQQSTSRADDKMLMLPV